jgi:YVTN family beta-propeller protein
MTQTTLRRAAVTALAVAGLAVLALLMAHASARGADTNGRVGPSLGLTGNGRALKPVGRMTAVGNFPTGSALTPDGRFVWVVDAGHGSDDVRVVDVVTGAAIQTLPLPGGYVGIAFSPDGRRAYVSGTPKGDSPTEGPTKGDAGDVVHVFSVDPATGRGAELDPITLPSPKGGSGQNNGLPPTPNGPAWPEGLAVTGDGRTLVVALNQADQVAIVDLATRTAKTVKVGAYPEGVAVEPRGRVAYVSNEYSGTISVIDLDGGVVLATISGVGGPLGDQNSHPQGMVVDRTASHLYVAVANRDLIADVDLRTRKVARLVSVERPQGIGAQPVALALSPDGRTLYSADSGEDAVAAIALTDRIGVAGTAGSTGAGTAPRIVFRHRTVAEIVRYRRLLAQAKRAYRRAGRTATAKRRYRRTLARIRARYLVGARRRACGGPTRKQDARWSATVIGALRRYGSRPSARSRSANRRFRALTTAAKRRLPLIRSCPGGSGGSGASRGEAPGVAAGTLIGKIPTAAYPNSVQATADRLVWVAGKGLGVGPNTNYVFSGTNTPYGSYVLDAITGQVGVLPRPTDLQVRSLTPAANAQAIPANAQSPPAGTPVVGPGGGPSDKIKHVFYIVRENRTYDQIFGTDPRGDGAPSLELFDDNGVSGPTGGVTPNAHALARTFPLLDHLYADSEVSVDGHVITEGGVATDYVQKAIVANYSNRKRAYDFGIYPVTFGPNAFVFDQAARQGVTFRSWGEVDAGNGPQGDDGRPTFGTVVANTDPTYPNEVLIGCTRAADIPSGNPQGATGVCTHDAGQLATTHGVIGGVSRVDTFTPKFQAMVAAGTVPSFNYLVLPNDHTNGSDAGSYTPKALVADNDLGLGQLVEQISQSSIWKDSVIFVVEDDSQDGADHVDAHRMPAFVISPYAKKGAVVSTRYDQYSVLRTAEMILGLKPLGLNDGAATPMYDAFTNGAPDVDGTRYTAIQPAQSLTDINTSSSPGAALSAALPFESIDMVPQALMDQVLWTSVYGADSHPPSPGPNASPIEAARAAGAMRVYKAGGDVRAYLRAHTPDPFDAVAKKSRGRAHG